MPTKTGILRFSRTALNDISDTQPGGANTDPYAPTTGLAPGQLGQIAEFNNNDIPFDSAVGTLYGGKYQYVRCKVSSVTTKPFVGAVVYWSDRANYVVSCDVASDAVVTEVAGIAINVPTNNGDYIFIQISGQATVKFKSSTSKGSPAIGNDVVTGLDADNGLADVLDDATAATFGTAATQVQRLIGVLTSLIDGTSHLATVALAIPNANN